MGAWDCVLKQGSLVDRLYQEYDTGKNLPAHSSLSLRAHPSESKTARRVSERHRHRYEFNNQFLKQFIDGGLIIAGTSPDDKLIEIVELAKHPFFVGTQFHPELKSRPLTPHPLFLGFIKACKNIKKNV